MGSNEQYFSSTESRNQRINFIVSELQAATDLIMNYLTSGNATSPAQWNELLKATIQALIIMEFLSLKKENLVCIADEFLQQFNDWKAELWFLLQ